MQIYERCSTGYRVIDILNNVITLLTMMPPAGSDMCLWKEVSRSSGLGGDFLRFSCLSLSGLRRLRLFPVCLPVNLFIFLQRCKQWSPIRHYGATVVADICCWSTIHTWACTCQELISLWHISCFPSSHAPDWTAKSPPISFEVPGLIPPHALVCQPGCPSAHAAADRNPAEELRAACSVAFIHCRDYRHLNVLVKTHQPL